MFAYTRQEEEWDTYFEQVKYDKYVDVINVFKKLVDGEKAELFSKITASAYLCDCPDAEKLYDLHGLNTSHAYATLDFDDLLAKHLVDRNAHAYASQYAD